MSDFYQLRKDQTEIITKYLGKRILPKELEAFCIEAMLKSGIREEDSRITADVLVTTDTWGVHTHGTKQLRFLLKNFRTGQLDSKAVPKVIREGTSWAVIDGNYAMPMKSSHMAMELAIDKAKKSGIAYVGVKRSSHFGAAGYYAVMAAKKDLIGLSMCNTDPCMTVPGGRGMILGTNPIAYSVPAGKERPIFLDIATSTVAAGKVLAAKALDKKIPDNWLVDDEGLPTNELNFPEHGALTPMTGHKGYGIALLIEILSAALTGAAMLKGVKSWALDLSEPSNAGHSFIAIDVGSIMPIREFKDRIDSIIREIKGSGKAKGSERIYLPGEREWENRDEALKNGMKLPENVLDSLIGLAEDVGLEITDFWGE